MNDPLDESDSSPQHPNRMRRLMQGMARLMPSDAESGENARAVAMMRRMLSLKDSFSRETRTRLLRRLQGQAVWPVTGGAYLVGDPKATIAICTLTDDALPQHLITLPHVAIAGRLYTPNLGIEKIVLNITANPAIRFLLVCGKESPVFQPGQALKALCTQGVTPERRIIGASGHFPVLANVPLERIETFRQQIELVDCMDEARIEILSAKVDALFSQNMPAFATNDLVSHKHSSASSNDMAAAMDKPFVRLKPGGHRQPLSYDPKGFFVITIDQKANDIVVRHYLPDNTPVHEMRGRSAEAILLGLIREDLISQMSHAGYVGYELAKAETAVRLRLRYEQDQPVRTLSA